MTQPPDPNHSRRIVSESEWRTGYDVAQDRHWLADPLYDITVYSDLEVIRNLFDNVRIFALLFIGVAGLAIIGLIYEMAAVLQAVYPILVVTITVFLGLIAGSAVIAYDADLIRRRALTLATRTIELCALMIIAAFVMTLAHGRWAKSTMAMYALGIGFLVTIRHYLVTGRTRCIAIFNTLIDRGVYESEEAIHSALKRVLYPDRLIHSRLNIFQIDAGSREDILETHLLQAVVETEGIPPETVEQMKTPAFREAMRHFMRYSVFLGSNVTIAAFMISMAFIYMSRILEIRHSGGICLLGFGGIVATVCIFRKRIRLMFKMMYGLDVAFLAIAPPAFLLPILTAKSHQEMVEVTALFVVLVVPLLLYVFREIAAQRKAVSLFRELGIPYRFDTLERLRIIYAVLAGFLKHVESVDEDGW